MEFTNYGEGVLGQNIQYLDWGGPSWNSQIRVSEFLFRIDST
jgi:hypothetical protein